MRTDQDYAQVVNSDQFETVLKQIYSHWRAWLRLRHHALKPLHEDIIQDAAADLLEYLMPAPESLLSEDIRRIGFTILKRRVADSFRSQMIKWAEETPLDLLPSNDPNTDPDRTVRYAKMLRLVIGLVARLDRRDRNLLLRGNVLAEGNALPMSEAERQRLSRLRRRLREQLAEQYGIDIIQYLKE